MTQPSPRADRWLLATLAVLVGAVVVQLLYYLQVTRSGPLLSPPMGDSTVYMTLAREIGGGGVAQRGPFYWSPLYPYLLSFMGRTLLLGLQMVAGIGTTLMAAAIAARIAGQRAGFFAALTCALSATPVVYQVKLVPVTLATALCAGATLVMTATRRDRETERPGDRSAGRKAASWRRWLPVGLCFGTAATLMPQLLVAPLLAVIGLAVGGRRRLTAALLVAAGTGAAVLPVSVRNLVVGRDFVPLSYSGGFNFYIGNNASASGLIGRPAELASFRADGRELVTIPEQQELQYRFAEAEAGRRLKASEVSGFWLKRGLGWLKAQPLKAAGLWLKKLLLALTGYEFGDSYYPAIERGLLWPLRLLALPFAALLGLAAAASAAPGRSQKPEVHSGEAEGGGRVASGELWPVLVVPGAVLVSLLVFFVNARFRLPAVPMLCVFAGLALDGALRLRRVKERVAVGAVFLVVTLGSGVMLPAVFGEAVKNDEVYGWINLSQNQLAAGDLQQAGQLLDRAAGLVGDRQNDDLARAYAWVGNRYLDRRDLGGAAGAYDKAIRSDHAYAPGYLMRGVVELTRGSADRALELAGEAIGSDPRLANAWVLRAKALLLLDRREEALASAAEAQRLDPDAALVRELLQQLGPTP